MEEKTIYNLDLHENLTIYIETKNSQDSICYVVTRVASGWIYQSTMMGVPASTSVFVPYDNQFMKTH